MRASGMAYERLVALAQRRAPRELYHSALVATVDGRSTVIEMTPVPDSLGRSTRGVVVEAPVGCRLAGHFRVFRYEIRRWDGGTIPDVSSAVGSPVLVSSDAAVIARALAVVPLVPAATWGRDEYRTGEMWNSNSVVAWILTQVGLVSVAGHPPGQGRAPGWDAGIAVGRRGLPTSPVSSLQS